MDVNRIEYKYDALCKALRTIEKGLAKIKETSDVDTLEMFRDSIIQRFEYTIDSFWKFLKIYLEEKLNVLVIPV
ncbi:MAG TPA: nucleotidyltransferase substrate binding protein, partial [Candidatus Bathyarchaeia archaeon]|nr:nucleotidyltransferase substrate binding protein [Candidatus Bathyarchaeia archaeon]